MYIQGGWRGSLRQRGGAREIERAPEAVGREREAAILISLDYKLPSPSRFTPLSNLLNESQTCTTIVCLLPTPSPTLHHVKLGHCYTHHFE